MDDQMDRDTQYDFDDMIEYPPTPLDELDL
jgi:hypothetical protein